MANDIKKPDENPSDGDGRYLRIDTLNYHGNDLHELRKIAETNPDLAEKLVEQKDRSDARENTSFRFGLFSALILVGMTLTTLSFLLYSVGVIATFVSMGVILAIALLIRVILTGEWSDTSWLGRIVEGLVKLLGGKPGD